jgi:NADH dehydrogenase [ubiquinone] 1 alpha subcomplex assembly factor 5
MQAMAKPGILCVMSDQRPSRPATPEAAQVFDRGLLAQRRDRAFARKTERADFLFLESAERLLDRLDDVTRKFPTALDLGSRDGVLARVLRGRGGIAHLMQGDLSARMLHAARRFGPVVRLDEEALPFGAATLDLVMANLSLHWVNDLPGTLAQIRYALKPDGLFLGAMFGAGTLAELQTSLLEAEVAVSGGASGRVSPFPDLRDVAGLLQRAGFALPVADLETLTVTYLDMQALLADLRAMGETNLLRRRLKRPTRRAVLAEAAAIYRRKFGLDDGRIPATFRLIYLTGWAPHESQQLPSRRGSGKVPLGQALGGD